MTAVPLKAKSALSTWFLVLGCSDTLLWSDFPNNPDAKSYVVEVDSGGTSYRYAGAWGEAMERTSSNREFIVSLAAFDQPLQALGVPASGQLASGNEDGCLIGDTASAFYALSVDDGTSEGWQDVSREQSSPSLVNLRLPGGACANPCSSFDVSYARLPGATRHVAWLISLDADTVLAGTYDNLVYRVSIDTVTPVTMSPVANLRSVTTDDQGQLWFGDDGGRVFRGDLGTELTTTLMFTHPEMGRITRLSWVGEELLILTTEGRLDVYAHGAWTHLRQMASQDNTIPKGGILTLDNGDALIAWTLENSILRYSDQQLTQESLEEANAGATAIGFMPGLGPVISVPPAGTLFVRQPGRWTLLGEGSLGLDGYAITTFRDRLLYGGYLGFAREYIPSSNTDCPAIQPAPSSIRFMAPLGDDAVILGGDGTRAVNDLTILHARP